MIVGRHKPMLKELFEPSISYAGCPVKTGASSGLLAALRRIALAHTQLAKATCGTLRLKFLKIGAQVTVTVPRFQPWLSTD